MSATTSAWLPCPVSDWSTFDHEEWSAPVDYPAHRIQEWVRQDTGSRALLYRPAGYWNLRYWDARTGDSEDNDPIEAFRHEDLWWWDNAPTEEVFAAVRVYLDETYPQ